MAKLKSILTVDNSHIVKAFYTIFIVYSCRGTLVIGTVTLSPVAVAPICQAGDQLELTCNINGSFIRWSLTVSDEQGRPQDQQRFINSEDESQQRSQLIVNSTTFTFMRTSARQSSPLISTLTIDSVSSNLNGTVVHCIDVGDSVTASTVIHLVDIGLAPLILVSASEPQYRANNVTVTLEWTQVEGVQYNISITPIPLTRSGDTSVQLILSYNVMYNVSVEATTVCQKTAPGHVKLFYAHCGEVLLSASNISKPSVTYSGPQPTEGTSVNFTCPPGLLLNGTNSITCTRNGEWKPDPQKLKCIEATCRYPVFDSSIRVVGYDDGKLPTELGTVINFTCLSELSLTYSITCMRNGEWEPDITGVCISGSSFEGLSGDGKIAVASSITVFIVSSIVFFFLGYLCGRYNQKHEQSTENSQQNPVYDDVQPKQRAQLELKTNEAYDVIIR